MDDTTFTICVFFIGFAAGAVMTFIVSLYAK